MHDAVVTEAFVAQQQLVAVQQSSVGEVGDQFAQLVGEVRLLNDFGLEATLQVGKPEKQLINQHIFRQKNKEMFNFLKISPWPPKIGYF